VGAGGSVRHCSARLFQQLALPYGRPRHTLIVIKLAGLFTLFETQRGEIRAVVKAMNAQMIQDYLDANWPVGTIAHWIIVPAFRPLNRPRPRPRLFPFTPASFQ
jgi:hypothetical protein